MGEKRVRCPVVPVGIRMVGEMTWSETIIIQLSQPWPRIPYNGASARNWPQPNEHGRDCQRCNLRRRKAVPPSVVTEIRQLENHRRVL